MQATPSKLSLLLGEMGQHSAGTPSPPQLALWLQGALHNSQPFPEVWARKPQACPRACADPTPALCGGTCSCMDDLMQGGGLRGGQVGGSSRSSPRPAPCQHAPRFFLCELNLSQTALKQPLKQRCYAGDLWTPTDGRQPLAGFGRRWGRGRRGLKGEPQAPAPAWAGGPRGL